MFSMQQIGKRIIDLRKRFNMTQTELADRMNISFQAVSNWERGNSMPDISKLPELAVIFNVTVDELIGENSKLIHSAMAGDVERYVATHQITEEELKTHIPILKPDQIETIMDNIDFTKFDDMVMFLPFLDEDTLDLLAQKKVDNDESIDSLLPFMGEKALQKIVLQKMNKGEAIDNFLPFLEDEALQKVFDEKMNRGESIDNFLPFLGDAALERMATEKITRGESVEFMMPFMSDAFIERIAIEKAKRGESIASMLPFLSDKFLRKIVLNSDK